MKKLLICRHSHAVGHDARGDFYRDLDKTGKHIAALAGERLAELNIVPELVVSSPAVRALRTAEIVSARLGYLPERIVSDMCIYEQDTAEVLALLQNICTGETTVMLFGHIPSVRMLAAYLSGTPEAHTPPGAVTALEFETAATWQDAFSEKASVAFRLTL
ncbi:MAG: histidine phosphatase family protein [Victivallales bacterium]|nr:histidine phosphatase family protein [Victivallales bacterium]